MKARLPCANHKMPSVAKSGSISAGEESRTRTPVKVLYLYAISRMPQRMPPAITAEGIDGGAPVEALRCEDYICWTSRVSKAEFADHIIDRMQDLEWLASAGLRHQCVVAQISSTLPTLPARFGTVFLNEASLARHIKSRKRALRAAFQRVADADEWGVKLFASAAPKKRDTRPPASGSEYLQRKAALMQPRSARKLDPEVQEFVSLLKRMALATGPGGKVSAGQPGLLWHGSFLIRKKDRKKLDAALRRYARRWKDLRRIDCSGPWPPYSFVGEHVH